MARRPKRQRSLVVKMLGWLFEPNTETRLPSTAYREYIASPRWSSRKVAYYRTHKRRCNGCQATRKIHLHHRTYDRLGCERDSDLVPLCERCHELVHAWHRKNRATGMTLEAATSEAIRVLQWRGPGRLTAKISERYQGSASVRYR